MSMYRKSSHDPLQLFLQAGGLWSEFFAFVVLYILKEHLLGLVVTNCSNQEICDNPVMICRDPVVFLGVCAYCFFFLFQAISENQALYFHSV